MSWLILTVMALPSSLAFLPSEKAAQSSLQRHATATEESIPSSCNDAKFRSPRTIAPINLLTCTPLERQYFQGITNYMARHEALLSVAATGKISKGALQSLEFLGRQASMVPNFVRTFTTMNVFGNSEPRVVQERDSLLVADGSRMDFAQAASYKAETIAYVASLDLQNIRDGVYPIPSELNDARTTCVQANGKTLQGLLTGLSLYMGAPNYTCEQTTSDTLRNLVEHTSSKIELPKYYQHDFHSVPGGFLNHQHVQCYDTICEVTFSGMHRLARRLALRPIWNEILRTRKAEPKLLDIGTGTGSFLLQIQEALPQVQLHALDISPAMAKFASETTVANHRRLIDKPSQPPQVQVANMEVMPYPDNEFDFVTETNTFHELPLDALRNVATEIARILQPGGLFVHLDANQMVDDPASVSGYKVGFDGQFVEPYVQTWMTETDLDAILSEVELVREAPAQTMFASTLRCYRKA